MTCKNGVARPEALEAWSRFLSDESGQDLIEYALVVAFIALGSVATMQGLATSLGSFFGSLGTTLTSSV
jgi:pilus assembly protein Flp/PilA